MYRVRGMPCGDSDKLFYHSCLKYIKVRFEFGLKSA
jgi:hypothetical protein